MLSDERILELYHKHEDRLAGGSSLFHFDNFARAIEREVIAPLIERIKEDEALVRKVLDALPLAISCNEFHHNAKDRHGIGEPCKPAQRYIEAFYAILQRLEEEK